MSAVRNRVSLFDLAEQLGRLTQAGSTKPKPLPWIKPPCLICDAPNPPYGVAVTDEAGCTREDWFCPAHVPPGFFAARDQNAATAAGKAGT